MEYERMTQAYQVFKCLGGPMLPFGNLYVPKRDIEQYFTPRKILVEIYNLTEDKMETSMSKIYNIRIESPFVLTPTEVKRKLGHGYKVISTEVEKDQVIPEIVDVESAFNAILKVGYRALARANHPDLGGDAQVMILLNKAKKEIEDLLKEVSC